MAEIKVQSFAKINLSIDVGPRGDNGFHEVDMVMQQLSLHDDVTVEYTPSDLHSEDRSDEASVNSGSFDIEVSTNRYYLPVDRRNLAYQAAELMADLAAERFPSVRPGRISICIRKMIPVAGGLAGGSGNGAAVLHALNILWDLRLSLSELMDLGAKLGSDVPFCVMGQARVNREFPEYIRKDPMAVSCARATGRGTELEPLPPLKCPMVIVKPKFSVSTAEVYKGIDSAVIGQRPDNDRLVGNMKKKAVKGYAAPDAELYADFINVLEEYTLAQYPDVSTLKEMMIENGAGFALMSGSGPTVFGVFRTMAEARAAAGKFSESGIRAYWTRTII